MHIELHNTNSHSDLRHDSLHELHELGSKTRALCDFEYVTVSPSAQTKAQALGQVQALGDWQLITVPSRVESGNDAELMAEIAARLQNSALPISACRLALDVRNSRFLSMKVIRYCSQVAAELAAHSSAAFVMIGCSERMRRHFEIYGSLQHIQLVRTLNEFTSAFVSTDNKAAELVAETDAVATPEYLEASP